MGIEFDLDYWIKAYENSYPDDVEGKYPVYIDKNRVEKEEKSPYFETMSQIVLTRGFLLKKEFVSIGKWKTIRQIHNYKANEEETVSNVTRQVLKERDISKQIRLLTKGKLKGVKIPVASAILTIVFPKEFCIIDYRAWRALKWLRKGHANQLVLNSYNEYSIFLDSLNEYKSMKGYLSYLQQLRSIAEKHDRTARQLEMALWKFDKMKGLKEE